MLIKRGREIVAFWSVGLVFPAFSLVFLGEGMRGCVLRSSGRTRAVPGRCPCRTKPGTRVTTPALPLSVAFWVKNGEKTPGRKRRRDQSARSPLKQMCSVCACRSGWQGMLWLERQEYLSLMAGRLPYLEQLISSNLACWASLLLVKIVTLYESCSFIPSAMARSYLAEFGSRDRASVSQFYYLLQSSYLLSKQPRWIGSPNRLWLKCWVLLWFSPWCCWSCMYYRDRNRNLVCLGLVTRSLRWTGSRPTHVL